MGQKQRKKQKRRTAKTADKHALYQLSVQDPAFEVHLANRYFRRRVGREPLSLREDFCGTALLCAEWVKSHPSRTALGVDIDPSVLAWGTEHVLSALDEGERARVTTVNGDVRDHHPERHDVVMALNYSYFCFKTRDTLRGYFATVREHLRPDGLFFLDLFGGWESQQILLEKRAVEDFTYVWDQAHFDPVTSDFRAHIHFRFADGTKLKEAFTYEWRLWTIPELRELLAEAGFGHVEVLWEEEDEVGQGTGTFKPREHADNDPGWNAYLLASVELPPRVAAKRAKRAEGG
ncbi:MAG: class I SAM-dependent methyltransferase [Sandaracinaceae bacterium]|nr:class I SAM-dependent methyltransferase [Sandaracinaceae bacterium]